MDTAVRPPKSPPLLIDAAPRRRRRWPIVLVALLIAVSGAGAFWIANVEPLHRGSSTLSIDDPAAHARLSFIQGLGVTGVIEKVPAHPGLTFRYVITVRNDGRFPVTILDAGGPPGDISLRLVGDIPDIYALHGRPVGAGVVPFRAFDLPPGTEAGLQLEVHLGDHACFARGASAQWYQVPITYRLLGITRHADLDTGIEVRIMGAPATC